jgi:transcriptional regulator with XRE-family HTH domain
MLGVDRRLQTRGEAVAEPLATFAGLLRELRSEARLTQEELAEASGIRPRSISDLERGVAVTPQRETIRRLADALQLTGLVRTQFETVARGRAFPTAVSRPMAAVADHDRIGGHTFISYIREDSGAVDRLQKMLEAAGVRVWRDTADLWPGEDWRAKIRHAITDEALVFIACFSSKSLGRRRSYQNEELVLAIEQLRMRRLDEPWLIPVRFDNCEIPEFDIGAGRTLSSLQRADLFGERSNEAAVRLATSIIRILGAHTKIR